MSLWHKNGSSQNRIIIFLMVAGVLMVGVLGVSGLNLCVPMVVLLMGVHDRHRVWMALACIAGLALTSQYYYLMETTLLVKAGYLALIGVVLLAGRGVLLRELRPLTPARVPQGD